MSVDMIKYEPTKIIRPEKILKIPVPPLIQTNWGPWDKGTYGIESILSDLLDRFNVKRDIALEFGMEYGYSSVALSNFFTHVIGVDTFFGDSYSGVRSDFVQDTRGCLNPYPNITIVQSGYEQFIKNQSDSVSYDLIHIDIIHTYKDTLECGLWATKHSPCVIFHDTLTYPEVNKAVEDTAEQSGLQYYNWCHDLGLGILVKE
jgi:hypothetical protein